MLSYDCFVTSSSERNRASLRSNSSIIAARGKREQYEHKTKLHSIGTQQRNNGLVWG